MAEGILYCVATPIGNLEDITARALRILAEVSKVYAEDTRVTRRMFTHFGIQNTLESLHDHNETSRVAQIQRELAEGMNVALVSDAGTPLISDPGYKLVNALGAAGCKIVPVPGASALIAALSVAGLPTDRFAFEGFLPAKSVSRRKLLTGLEAESRTLVFYESSHRIADLLEDMIAVFGGERQIVVLRELTKLYESIYRGTATEILQHMAADSDRSRGEFVVVVAGKVCDESADALAVLNADKVLAVLLEVLPVKQAAAVAARLTGLPKNQLYRQALEQQDATD
ncbi:16S rRNA (cytidine(1402)-2'-O)-methyltransferase [Candidatus Thiothrix anitrata]|uniref:Ribosomal RNA small subunit methyltransferase I n=1 Tax=Candidatus Thiothrix anitrata TaxID=2823902 RepID=A0ABX7X862_9GAMM|nr:16S rRNA (cytidine(1402)-2'-O)-methyltransferase [Candidatus Thiothrix anitrata]QTR50490.1 16S rRNA (cytidine(1402)-2'-O)-methyltransferase [Candidatus Thiothrix anitrata]